MKTLIAFVLALGFIGTAEAQTVKTVAWADFAPKIEFADVDGGKAFFHSGRPLHEYTVVEAPAGIFTIRAFWRLGSEDGITLYLATLNAAPVTVVGRDASVRVMFSCQLESEAACHARLSEHLKKGVPMQSLGVANAEASSIPDAPILAFLVNTAGRFKY